MTVPTASGRATSKSAKFPQAQRAGGESNQGDGEINRSTSLFRLTIGQSVGLGARFGLETKLLA